MVTVDTSKQELSQAYSATDNSTRNLSNYSPNNNTVSPVITNPINISLSQNDASSGKQFGQSSTTTPNVGFGFNQPNSVNQGLGHGLGSLGGFNFPILATISSAAGGYAGGYMLNYNPNMSAGISGISYLVGDQIANYYNGSVSMPNPYDKYAPPDVLPSGGKNQIITFAASTALGVGIMSYLGSPIAESLGISLISSATGIAADYISSDTSSLGAV